MNIQYKVEYSYNTFYKPRWLSLGCSDKCSRNMYVRVCGVDSRLLSLSLGSLRRFGLVAGPNLLIFFFFPRIL